MAEHMVEDRTGQGASTKPTTPIKVKKLGHVVYSVSDIDRSTRFWTDIVGFSVSDRNERGMVFLRCARDHHTVALVPAPGKVQAEEGEYLGINHFAMEVDTLETLIEARDFLRAMGVPIAYEGRRGPGSNLGVEFLDPDGYLLEIYWGMDQIGKDGESRPADQLRRASSLEEAIASPVPEGW